MPPSNRRHQLRNHTANSHAALDETVGPLDSLAGYRRYLRGLHAFREPAERLIAAGLAARPDGLGDLRPTRIVTSMLADMTDVGVSPMAPVELAAPSGPSGLVGLVYVLEGSALGARLLKRQAAGLGLGPEHGARHLAVQADSLDGWHGFLAVLDAFGDYDETEAVAAAEAAFAAARSAFAELDAGARDVAARG
jgi:heme oxygenase